MDKILNILNTKFGEEFSYLKTLEVVYNTLERECTISFLYPESVASIENEKKEKIYDFLKSALNLNAKLVLKFKKSYLDNDLIIDCTMSFFKKNYSSLASVLQKSNITIKKDNFEIKTCVALPKTLLQNFDITLLQNNLKTFLQSNFLALFSADFVVGEELNTAKILESKNQMLEKKLRDVKKTARYRVFDVVKILGNDIAPEPEFLVGIKEPKLAVILAGKIEDFTKKSYKRKRNGTEIEKWLYKFLLNENGKKISCVYFCSKSNLKKMDRFKNGDSVIVVADIKKDNNFLTAYIKSISFCTITEAGINLGKEKINTYKTVFPEKLEKFSQQNLFEKDMKYNKNIRSNTFVVFDVETTGLESSTEEIIEIGAIKIENGMFVEKFQTLVKPKKQISEFITEITGITNEMVENSPNIEDVIKDFLLFSQDAVLSGYNVNFDMGFIQKAGREVGFKFENEVQDVMSLARQKVRSSNFKLGTIVKVLNITLANAHRALNDAIATAEVLLKLSLEEN
ncbi:MAG: exonuclease domain-containing protein [Clostridia bacterium]|nr:exonuclease domain-containing protein [Clostridia bacterium]